MGGWAKGPLDHSGYTRVAHAPHAAMVPSQPLSACGKPAMHGMEGGRACAAHLKRRGGSLIDVAAITRPGGGRGRDPELATASDNLPDVHWAPNTQPQWSVTRQDMQRPILPQAGPTHGRYHIPRVTTESRKGANRRRQKGAREGSSPLVQSKLHQPLLRRRHFRRQASVPICRAPRLEVTRCTTHSRAPRLPKRSSQQRGTEREMRAIFLKVRAERIDLQLSSFAKDMSVLNCP
jgi:hypothetical protein